MYKNYLKIALRNLFKNRAFSFINIFGLAAGISVCLLVILILKDSYSFDRFHPKEDQVYRVTTTALRKSGGEEAYATSPYVVANTLAEKYSQVELWTPLVRRFSADILTEGERIDNAGFFTNSSFFDMFGFELAAGDPATALEEPYTVVLTNEVAQKVFGKDNPVGQFVELPAYDQSFKVTGVLKPFPGKTHLEFDVLGALSTYLALERQEEAHQLTSNFLDYYATYNFLRLKSSADRPEAMAALSTIANEEYEGLRLESRDKGYKFELQTLNDITPGPMYSNSMGRFMPRPVLWFLSILSIVVILTACFNYTNLTIARALTRAREVGVRKVMGANRKQLFGQFVSESVVVALFSFVIGLVLLQLTIPGFNSIDTLAELEVDLSIDAQAFVLFLGFTILIGLLAGLLPASVLSRFSPLSALQRLETVRLFRRVGLRKALITMQFAISLVFILVLSIAWKQINFAIRENFASDRSDIINIQMHGQEYDKLSNAFRQLPEVQSISATSHLMGTWQDSKIDVRMTQEADPIGVRDYVIDHEYLGNFGIELIAGENFPNNLNQQQELFAIVNEDFLNQFEVGTPQEAVGKTILMGDSTQLAIRGVVKDFRYKPLSYEIEPLLLRYNPEHLYVMHLAIRSAALPETIKALERSWKGLDPSRSLNYSFYDETIAANYADMKDLATILGYCGVLGIIIACLGLLGMAIYSVETKAKEISIRKVIGATSADLVKLLSKGYVLLLLIAVVLAVPASYFIGKMMLQGFAYSIPLNLWVFLPGVLILLLLGAITIASQTIRAATGNPSESLRQE